MFWFLPMIADALGKGAGAAAKAVGSAATSALGKAALPAATSGGPSMFEKLGQSAMGKINPVIDDLGKNVADFANPTSAGAKIGDIIQTAQDAHNLKSGFGGGGGMAMQQDNPAQMQMPTIDPDKHLNPPNEMGIRTFNDQGTQMLNNHVNPQRFNGYPTIGQPNPSNN